MAKKSFLDLSGSQPAKDTALQETVQYPVEDYKLVQPSEDHRAQDSALTVRPGRAEDLKVHLHDIFWFKVV